jgi:hypothetical protein
MRLSLPIAIIASWKYNEWQSVQEQEQHNGESLQQARELIICTSK